MDQELLDLLRERAPVLTHDREEDEVVMQQAEEELDNAVHGRNAHTIIAFLLRCSLEECMEHLSDHLEPRYLKYLASKIVEHRLKNGC